MRRLLWAAAFLAGCGAAPDPVPAPRAGCGCEKKICVCPHCKGSGRCACREIEKPK
jgi:hypothetical protein